MPGAIVSNVKLKVLFTSSIIIELVLMSDQDIKSKLPDK